MTAAGISARDDVHRASAQPRNLTADGVAELAIGDVLLPPPLCTLADCHECSFPDKALPVRFSVLSARLPELERILDQGSYCPKHTANAGPCGDRDYAADKPGKDGPA